MHFESPESVQHFLNQLEPLECFTVIFMKTDGTQKQLSGWLDPNGSNTGKDIVPMQVQGGWKSFSKSRVLSLQRY